MVSGSFGGVRCFCYEGLGAVPHESDSAKSRIWSDSGLIYTGAVRRRVSTLVVAFCGLGSLGCEPASEQEPQEEQSQQEEDASASLGNSGKELPDPGEEGGDEASEQGTPKSKKSQAPGKKDSPKKEEPSGDAKDDTPLTEPVDLPKVTGKCPNIASGIASFAPKGLKKPRNVKLWVDPSAKGKKGPLFFYWHGTAQSPDEALTGLGPYISKITAMGGVVAAPFHDPESGTFPWFLVEGVDAKRMDDLILADEILACAQEQVGIDTRRIHTLGLSAGALQSTQMSYRRSNYIASSVLYSGGLIVDAPKSKESRNRFSSMIFHGGPSDIVVVKFKETSERFLKDMVEKKRFAFICDHQSGHIIPRTQLDNVWKFFTDHPFAAPSPYKEGLPAEFPDYCKLP